MVNQIKPNCTISRFTCAHSLATESVCNDQGYTWCGDLASYCQVPEAQAGAYLSSIEPKAIRPFRSLGSTGLWSA